METKKVWRRKVKIRKEKKQVRGGRKAGRQAEKQA